MDRMLICCYNSICEPDMVEGFEKNGYIVDKFTKRMKDPDFDVEYLKELSQVIVKNSYDFVFSVDFFPIISKLCNALHIPYVCWVVDAPFFLLNAPEVAGEYNRIFLFDRALYLQYKERNPQGIFHLPLGANTTHLQNVIKNAHPADRFQYGKEIAFIGSLYTEKSVYNRIDYIPHEIEQQWNKIIKEQLYDYKPDVLEEVLTEKVLNEFFRIVSLETVPEGYLIDRKKFVADEYLAVKMTEIERIYILNTLAEEFLVSVYTESDVTPISNAIFCGSAESRQEMPKIFHYSKINLNPTARGIRSGISQRVWDVLGTGGFLLCNPQPEIMEIFDSAEDIETYKSAEELRDKCRYYLKHNQVRENIAKKGFYKVEKYHTYEKRVKTLLQMVQKSFLL